LIGLLLPAGRDHFFHVVESRLRGLVEGSGYELLPFVATGGQVSESWRRLLNWDLDGVFVFDYLLYIEGLWKALVEHKGTIPPMVGLFSSQPKIEDYVTFDFRPGMEALLEHFTAQGAKSIGYMAPTSSFQPDEQRYDAYLQYIGRKGLQAVGVPVQPDDNLCEGARRGIHAYLDNDNVLPEALFCQNDEIALGAYHGLHERGIVVPDSVLLAGCDDIPYVAYLERPLTTLSLPAAAACREAWQFLQKRMEDPSGPPMRSVLEAQLRVRASSTRSIPSSIPTERCTQLHPERTQQCNDVMALR